MDAKERLLRPEVIGGLLGMLMMGGLMYSGDIESVTGMTVIMGILAALGAYQMDSPPQKKK